LKYTVPAIFLTCSCLLPIPQAALAAGQWQCQSLEHGLWDCIGNTHPDQDPEPGHESARIAPVTNNQPVAAIQPTPAAPKAQRPKTPAPKESALSANVHSRALCPSRTPDAPIQVETDSDLDSPIRLDADSAQISNENIYTLKGNAEIRYGTKTLQADEITYDEAEGSIAADGAIRLTSPALVVEGHNARLSTTTGTGVLEQIRYTLPLRHARGSADRLELKSRDKAILENAVFTTCPEDNTDWQLTASKITLDQATGSGTARNAKLTFKGVPLLYSPIIGFPIDDRRKSGFLAPRLGTSDETGVDISTPWYWNIAPNHDATITPRIMTSRGFMLGGEFRYLNKRSQGQLDFAYLPSDNKFGNEDRSLFSIKHDGNPFSRLVTHINAADISDDDYFRDLGSSQLDASQTHLERTAGVV